MALRDLTPLAQEQDRRVNRSEKFGRPKRTALEPYFVKGPRPLAGVAAGPDLVELRRRSEGEFAFKRHFEIGPVVVVDLERVRGFRIDDGVMVPVAEPVGVVGEGGELLLRRKRHENRARAGLVGCVRAVLQIERPGIRVDEQRPRRLFLSDSADWVALLDVNGNGGGS